MIDLKIFLIITQEQFETLIQAFNCNLNINDPSYMATYLFTNLMAYVVIYFIIKVCLILYFEIFKKNRGRIL